MRKRKQKNKQNVVGPRIRHLRMAARPRVTQEDMIARLARFGIRFNQSQYARIESGERGVRDYELIAIARALRIRVSVIFD